MCGPTTLRVSLMIEMGDQGPEGERDQYQVANLKPGPGMGFTINPLSCHSPLRRGPSAGPFQEATQAQGRAETFLWLVGQDPTFQCLFHAPRDLRGAGQGDTAPLSPSEACSVQAATQSRVSAAGSKNRTPVSPVLGVVPRAASQPLFLSRVR